MAGEALGGLPRLPTLFTSIMLGLNVAVGGTIVFTLLALFAQQRHDALGALRIEQEKAENLLLNILPRPIAEKLKASSQTIADQFTSASILFADVVDFTPRSEHLPPAEVVGILDSLFSYFDTLVEKYGLEKIKTIGDCYMIAAGVPTPRPDHARALALVALDMLQAVRSTGAVGDLGLELRVGINSGGWRHRAQALPLRPLGRRGQYREPDAVAGNARLHPSHRGHIRAAEGGVRLRATGDGGRQGQGRDGDLVRPRPQRQRSRSGGISSSVR
jgi:hypothetical protein